MKDHGKMPIKPPSVPRPLHDQIKEDLIAEFRSPLKLISYSVLVGFLFPYLTLNWQTTVFIFSSLWVPTVATVGLVAFNERDLRHEMNFWEWIYLVYILCIGAFTVEFVGISVHTLTSLFHGQHNQAMNFWDGIAVGYTIIGGIGLSISHSIGRYYRHKNINDAQKALLAISFTVFLVLFWIIEYNQNPHDPLKMLIVYLQTMHPI